MRSAAPLCVAVFQSSARAGIAMLFMNCIAGQASAQSIATPDALSGPVTIEPASNAPPRSIIQRYTPLAPHARAEMSLLVDAPPAAGAVASSAATGGELAAPIGDHVDGAAINTLAGGRSAITVTTGGARRQ